MCDSVRAFYQVTFTDPQSQHTASSCRLTHFTRGSRIVLPPTPARPPGLGSVGSAVCRQCKSYPHAWLGGPSACLARLCSVPSSSNVFPLSCTLRFAASHHSMDMSLTSSEKWHVSAALHTSSSFRHCCIFGQLSCSVKNPRPRFQALCPSSFSSLSSQGGGPSSLRGELSHLTASSGIKSRCDP